MTDMTDAEWAKLIHDLRSPVIAIDGFVKILLEKPESLTADEKSAYLKRINANVESLFTQLEQLKTKGSRCGFGLKS